MMIHMKTRDTVSFCLTFEPSQDEPLPKIWNRNWNSSKPRKQHQKLALSKDQDFIFYLVWNQITFIVEIYRNTSISTSILEKKNK